MTLPHMTVEERRAYVRGVLTTCIEFKAPEDLVMKVCLDLGIDAGELEEVGRQALTVALKKKEK
jgi:hypothetical protein